MCKMITSLFSTNCISYVLLLFHSLSGHPSALSWECTWKHCELFTLNTRSKTPRLALHLVYECVFIQYVCMAHLLALTL